MRVDQGESHDSAEIFHVKIHYVEKNFEQLSPPVRNLSCIPV
jgi:hypothetical protein